MTRLVRGWRENTAGPRIAQEGLIGLRRESFALSAAGHKFMNRFAGIFPLLQDGVHLPGYRHLDGMFPR